MVEPNRVFLKFAYSIDFIMNESPKAAIIGGGAAGFFAAIALKERRPDMAVTIYEAQARVLSKLALTGGGRCNLSNTFAEVANLQDVYPRGARLMKKCFYEFDHNAVWLWFEQHNVKLYAQDDGRVFPVSNRATEITDMLVNEACRLGVEVLTLHRLERISLSGDGYCLHFTGVNTIKQAGVVIVATGGFQMLSESGTFLGLSLKTVPPVPSLFAFDIRDNRLRALSGLGCQQTVVRLPGTKFCAQGDLLVTHFGLSGPAVLKLSSYAARYLSDNRYRALLSVNWTGQNEERVRLLLRQALQGNHLKQMGSVKWPGSSSRLWQHLLKRAETESTMLCADIGKKQQNKLVNILTNDEYLMSGKATNKDEFVTCGGVSLSAIRPSSMESTDYPNLYFIGEALDVDAVTGGFNLQAAWSTAFVAAQHVATSFSRQK